MKYYIIAGEISGDLHSALVIRNIKKQDPEAEFRCWGGDTMAQEGALLVRHIKDLAFMGFAEVLAHARTVLGNLSFCKKDLLEYKPDAVLLTDYPGFNLRIAKFAKKHGMRVYYYVSPQVWAWKKNRIKTIKRYIDKLFVILPFEQDFYKAKGIQVEYYGNPLLDEITEYGLKQQDKTPLKDILHLDDKPIVALLPGSRTQEIKAMLPVQLEVYDKFKDRFNFIVAGVSTHSESFYKQITGQRNLPIVFNDTYRLLHASKAALVCSGTATLETALFNVPQVVCYRSSLLSYIIAVYIVHIKYISLVNLIMKKEVVKELIQKDCNGTILAKEFEKTVFDEGKREEIFQNYRELHTLLGGGGCSTQIASYIVNDIKKPQQ